MQKTLEEYGEAVSKPTSSTATSQKNDFSFEAQEKPSSVANEDRGRSKEIASSQRESSSSAGQSREREFKAEEKSAPFQNENQSGNDNNDDRESGNAGDKPIRPTTARRRPPKVKDGAKEVTAKESSVVAPGTKKTEGILIDGQADDDEDDLGPEDRRLADDLLAEDKTAKGSGGSEPQSKLVKDILSRQAEQEAASKSERAGGAKEEALDSKAETNNVDAGI